MTPICHWMAACLVLVTLSAPLDAAKTQSGPASRPPATAAPPARAEATAPSEPSPAVDAAFPETEWRREIVRLGSSYTLAADDGARQVTVIGGDATIEGRVTTDVVVVLGQAHLAASALIDGSLVVVGGTVSIADGARVGQDLVVVAGRLDAPQNFAPGNDYTVIGPQYLGERFGGVFEWLSRGPLWGRLIVPSLGWVWIVVAIFFFVYLVLGLLFERPVREIAELLQTRPFTALVVGFLVTLLLGPVCVLLAVSVVGIAVIPLVLGALFAAWMLGKVGVARWIGRRIAGEAESPRLDAIRSFVIGFAVVSIAYLIPVVGIVTWTLLSVFAIGASTLSFLAAYRRESPVVAAAPTLAASMPIMAMPSREPALAMAGGGSAMTGDMPQVLTEMPAVLPMFPRAAFRDRLASGLLDFILVLITWGLIDPILRGNGFFVLLLAYFVGFWAWKGTTVGGIICQLRLVRVDGQPLRFIDALVRGLSGIFSLLVIGLGFLWILRDPERQAWHDRIAGTYVVKVPRNYPL